LGGWLLAVHTTTNTDDQPNRSLSSCAYMLCWEFRHISSGLLLLGKNVWRQLSEFGDDF
jgi:hypothetical protein